MRLAALAFSGLFVLAACGQEAGGPSSSQTTPVEPVAVAAADQLTSLTAPVTGIAFWTHPNVAFNSLMIIADGDGVASYNIEDGSEVSSIPGVSAQGAAVSYIGFGPRARGLLAFFNTDASAFSIYEINNLTRSFKPVSGDIPVRGAVRGFCFGRAAETEGPTLAILQKGELTRYAFRIENATLTASAGVSETAPDDVVSCAVDTVDGSIFVARANGAVHRIGVDGQGALFAKAPIGNVGNISVLATQTITGETPSPAGQVILLDKTSGAIHAFDRGDGASLGVVTIGEAFEIEAVDAASVMGAISANLGALYRNGAIALAVAADAGAVRLIPANGLANALDIAEGEPLSPRGFVPEPDDDGLLIRTNIQLE